MIDAGTVGSGYDDGAPDAPPESNGKRQCGHGTVGTAGYRMQFRYFQVIENTLLYSGHIAERQEDGLVFCDKGRVCSAKKGMEAMIRQYLSVSRHRPGPVIFVHQLLSTPGRAKPLSPNDKG
uniref:Uncharacterized protein n=1 Tax=Candidatus Kentrum sp. MB TaxID=2138164 RepID=A0A450Y0W4_9GAMM|nr:MAG: hypothetical protein BECKMB1821G_GA0114241_105914 [Candidatus Kentron sp. MB]VFK35171.1 MAG: hypothetical protein BECKMB1821I_GA0114274_11033 [Candidatus Kentron sp. MB]VFK77104.1 MAG: hypothetical protein BECKMB1821H_GA0114242_11003 [Candidatus Kentron sp. MB]